MLPTIKITMDQRTATNHMREQSTYVLIAYCDESLALRRGKAGPYERPIAQITVDHSSIIMGSRQDVEDAVFDAACRKGARMGLVFDDNEFSGRYAAFAATTK
jgi:hypothetical protein